MTVRQLHVKAIVAALFAVAIAFPVSANAQAPDQHVQRTLLHSCLRHDVCPSAGSGLERQILFEMRGWDGSAARIVFGAADASAYPMFAAAPAALWGAALAGTVPTEDAVAGTAALAAGFGTAIVLKRLVGRDRPYASIPGFSARTGHTGTIGLSDSASFPSGHATLAGALAAGATLLMRHPAVTAGASAWAVTVSMSRLWLGVHYPTDVGAGLLLGAGSAALSLSVLR